jgi:phosphomevalonate kinase
MRVPRRVLCISGKRFCGKDTFAELLVHEAAQVGRTVSLHSFAGHSKRQFVEEELKHGRHIDLAKLSSDRTYKELHRPALTAFTMRNLKADSLCFVRQVAKAISNEPAATIPLITDLRLKIELPYFHSTFICCAFFVTMHFGPQVVLFLMRQKTNT